jgi:hypothetical protein
MTLTHAIRFAIDETTRFISPTAVAAEWVLVVVCLMVCLLLPAYAPSGRWRWLEGIRNGFVRLAHRTSLCILLCGIVPVVARLSMLGFAPVPEPSIHDEFSHLLLADTLAHGRLTNPPHPMWQHFESIHIIQQPTYNSMYPPAQGAMLALGQVVFHQPWAGVLIAVGCMFAAVCWMMQGWLAPQWALYGTLIAILKIGIYGLWIDSYLPAAVPAIGGALVVGALPRLSRENASAFHSFLFGLGAVILMESRPFEGAVLGVAALVYLGFALFKRPGLNLRQLGAIILPAGLVLACGICFTGYYSYRVTGNPLRPPYQVNRDTYGWPENLGFLPTKKLVLRDRTLQDMYLKEINHREIYGSPQKFLDNLVTRLFDNWTVLAGPLLTIPLFFLPWIFREPKTRPLAVFLALAAVLNLFQMVLYPYQLAAVVPVFFAVVAEGVRRIYAAVSALNGHRGLHVALMLPVCLILIYGMKQQAEALNIPLAYWERAAEPHRDARESIIAWLKAREKQHLVIVRYGPGHPPNQEWVYNKADVDGSKIVWARETTPEEDCRLLEYYPNREVWLLKADEIPQRVVPYPLAHMNTGEKP